ASRRPAGRRPFQRRSRPGRSAADPIDGHRSTTPARRAGRSLPGLSRLCPDSGARYPGHHPAGAAVRTTPPAAGHGFLMHQVSGRVVAVSVRAAIIAGGWIGFALGLVAGSVLGATLAWFAGAILSWQRDLSLTLGVTEQLLPFGSQVPVLERVQADWFIVVPFAGVLVGLFAALVGGLIGGLVAASYNRSPFGVQVVVEVPNQTS